MPIRRRWRAFAALALATALTTTACGTGGTGGPEGSSAPQRGGDLVFARTAGNTTLDPVEPTDNESIWTNQQIYDTLYAVTPDGKDIRPSLATSYEVSEDKLTYTFQLREDVKFSNGRPMTADDVAFSINRAANSGEGLTYLDAAIQEVTATEKYTVQVTTKYPWGPLVADLSLFVNAVIPEDFAGKSEEEFFEKPIGTGPFMVAEWNKGRSLELVRNPHYWKKNRPYLDSITYTRVADENQRVLQLKGRQAHIVRFPPDSQLESLKAMPTVEAKAFPSSSVTYVLMNNKKEPFDDVHVRRALSYAIDREALVKGALFGHGEPADSFLAISDPHHTSQPSLTHDLAKAKKELALSSVPGGFSTELLVTPSGTRVAEILQQQLKKIGVKVSIRTVDANQILDVLADGKYEMSVEYWTDDIPDSDERTSWFLDQESGNDYHTFYENPELKKLVTQAQRETDQGKRAELYEKIQQVQASELPQIPLYYSPYAYAWSTKVHGFDVTPLGNSPMENVWLAK